MAVFPTGFDWGDGVTNLPNQPIGAGGFGTFGTPTPTSAITVALPPGATTQPAQENPDSPEIERAEQATVVHTFKMDWDQGKALITGLGRGTFLQDSFTNITRVLSSKIKRMRGNQCEITVIAESISFDTPPDEFQIDPIDLGLDLIKHPRYSWALAPVSTDTSTYTVVGDQDINFVQLKSSIIRMIQSYRDAPFFPSEDQVNGLIQSNVLSMLTENSSHQTFIPVSIPVAGYDPDQDVITPPVWDGVTANLPSGNYSRVTINVPVDMSDPDDPIVIAIAAAKEIISKLWRQEDTPYLTGWQIRWTQYFFAPTYLNPGGYIQDPLTVVPSYFMQVPDPGTFSTLLARGDVTSPFSNQDTISPFASGNTILDHIAAINPQSYSDNGRVEGDLNISWLRKADEYIYQRTWFAVTHCWIGSPIGSWDQSLYTQGNRPQNANGFDQLI